MLSLMFVLVFVLWFVLVLGLKRTGLAPGLVILELAVGKVVEVEKEVVIESEGILGGD